MMFDVLFAMVLSAPGADSTDIRQHRPPAVLEPRIHTRHFSWKGEFRRSDDGGFEIVQAVPEAIRRAVSKAQRKPLRAIQSEIRRRIDLHPEGPSEASLERWLGKQVRVELGLDRTGSIYLLSIGKPELTTRPIRSSKMED